MYQARPIDLLRSPPTQLELGVPTCNPFADEGSLVEAYFFGSMHDTVNARLALLLGTWLSLCQETLGNVGLLVFSGVAESAWKVRQWDVPGPHHWWTVLSAGFAPLEGPTGVTIQDTPGFEGYYRSSNQGLVRFNLGLNPNSQVSVVFESADYYAGTQDQIEPEDETKLLAKMDATTEWHAASHWPR